MKAGFSFPGNDSLHEAVVRLNDFRNRYVGHQETELTDSEVALREIKHWVQAVIVLSKALQGERPG